MVRILVLSGLALGLLGCGNGGQTQQKTNYTYVDADQQKAANSGQEFEDPSKIAGSYKKADVDKQQKVVSLARAAYTAAPTDARKKKLVDATVDLANKTMYCDDFSPKEKYRGALKIFRQALALDPHNKPASEAADTITSIYKSMGKPVPE